MSEHPTDKGNEENVAHNLGVNINHIFCPKSYLDPNSKRLRQEEIDFRGELLPITITVQV